MGVAHGVRPQLRFFGGERPVPLCRLSVHNCP
jgi:hypothetical protein